jgi:hypothetical protein
VWGGAAAPRFGVAGHLPVIVRAGSGVRAPYSGPSSGLPVCHLKRRDALLLGAAALMLASRRGRAGAAQA